MTDDRKELEALRLSVRKLAEFVNIDPKFIPAVDAERGWNRLVAVIMDDVEAHWDPW